MSPPLPASDALRALRKGISLSFQDPVLKGKLFWTALANALACLGFVGLLFWLSGGLLDWGVDEASTMHAAHQESSAATDWLLALFWGGLVWLLEAFGWFVYLALLIGALMYAPVLLSLTASLVLPPLHGPVFVRARECTGGVAPGTPGTGLLRSTVNDLRRLVRFSALSLLLLPLHLLPVVGSALYIVAQFYLSAKTMGWDLLAHHFELHDMDRQQQRAWVSANARLVLVLGAGAALLTMIPLVQLVFITTNVAGAGVLSARLDGALGARGVPELS